MRTKWSFSTLFIPSQSISNRDIYEVNYNKMIGVVKWIAVAMSFHISSTNLETLMKLDKHL